MSSNAESDVLHARLNSGAMGGVMRNTPCEPPNAFTSSPLYPTSSGTVMSSATDGKKWAPHFTDKAPETHEMDLGKQQADAGVFYTNLIEYYSPRMDGDTLVFRQFLSMFPSGLPGIALLPLRASWPIVRFFARTIAPLAMAIQFAGAWVAPLGPWRSKRDAYCGKSSGVVNLPSGDNATFLLVAALMAGVAISDPAFESTASAIH
jgi:hypothetical protein